MQWKPQPAAATWVRHYVSQVVDQLPGLRSWAERLVSETGTRLIDWLDCLVVPAGDSAFDDLGFYGFTPGPDGCWRHPEAILPTVVPDAVAPNWTLGCAGLAIRVESLQRFLSVHQGTPQSLTSAACPPGLSMAVLERQRPWCWWAVERHGATGYDPSSIVDPSAAAWRDAETVLAGRLRNVDNLDEGFHDAQWRIRQAIHLIGQDRTADLFFALERAYWQSRNRAAQVQKARQDRLGLGWANHDHHTFRNSRAAFRQFLSTLELLGMECRERFYAGADAGWGAQVLEHPACQVVVFADVDLAADELTADFLHQPLPERATVGTVGLWCALHGESFLQAGMHHLECQFDFAHARKQLEAAQIRCLPPFTDLPYLKQAFTEPEPWPVAESRLRAAQTAGWISAELADRMRQQGAWGSHLEILQRDDGFKGFNQVGISDIIRRTDMRMQS